MIKRICLVAAVLFCAQAALADRYPPTNVTDAILRGEVDKVLQTQTFDASAIYEVLLPPASYSSDGNSTSCGGPALAYCAYHGHYAGANGDTKYASIPYPSCGGCQ